MATQALAIWLYDRVVAIVEKRRNARLRLSYTEQALDAYEGGTPLLSLALPLTREPYPNAVTRAFLDGLLPEGEPRQAIAADLDVRASDVFGLLAALGRDCAGALVVQPAEDPPPPRPTTCGAEPLSPDDLAGLIANLHRAPLGIDGGVRLSLAGVQEKLLLTRMADGRWGRPVHGTPSTHILKPEIEPYGDTVENEAFCMTVARHLGLDVARVETIHVDGRPVLAVERFDRSVDADGAVRRIHQEDLCQALSLPPEQKHEQNAGPTHARIAAVLRSYAERSAPQTLLRAMTLNVALGNCDAHAKNMSLIHTEAGTIRTAPLYDLLSTRLYPRLDDSLAIYVDSVQKADRVTAQRIANEAVRWGMPRHEAAVIVDETLERLPQAISAAAAEAGDTLPPRLPELVSERVARLAARFPR
jgi:serine/threonine-protein kinase HipA